MPDLTNTKTTNARLGDFIVLILDALLEVKPQCFHLLVGTLFCHHIPQKWDSRNLGIQGHISLKIFHHKYQPDWTDCCYVSNHGHVITTKFWHKPRQLTCHALCQNLWQSPHCDLKLNNFATKLNLNWKFLVKWSLVVDGNEHWWYEACCDNAHYFLTLS